MNSMWILCYCLFCVCFCCEVIKALPINSTFTVKRENKLLKMILRNELQVQCTTDHNEDVITANISKVRVKRDSTGAGKFVEAAEMPQIKLVRLFLQMFKNLYDDSYVGGTHPLHPNVPKAIVQLYKERIVEFFLPDIGQEIKGN